MGRTSIAEPRLVAPAPLRVPQHHLPVLLSWPFTSSRATSLKASGVVLVPGARLLVASVDPTGSGGEANALKAHEASKIALLLWMVTRKSAYTTTYKYELEEKVLRRILHLQRRRQVHGDHVP